MIVLGMPLVPELWRLSFAEDNSPGEVLSRLSGTLVEPSLSVLDDSTGASGGGYMSLVRTKIFPPVGVNLQALLHSTCQILN